MHMVFSRWKPFLLYGLYDENGKPSYYSKLTKQLPLSQKVLSQNLRDLERDGLVVRTVIPDIPPRVLYSLTEQGQKLIPLLKQVYEWGWNDMKSKNLPINTLGEMWHGHRERDEALMHEPYKNR